MSRTLEPDLPARGAARRGRRCRSRSLVRSAPRQRVPRARPRPTSRTPSATGCLVEVASALCGPPLVETSTLAAAIGHPSASATVAYGAGCAPTYENSSRLFHYQFHDMALHLSSDIRSGSPGSPRRTARTPCDPDAKEVRIRTGRDAAGRLRLQLERIHDSANRLTRRSAIPRRQQRAAGLQRRRVPRPWDSTTRRATGEPWGDRWRIASP